MKTPPPLLNSSSGLRTPTSGTESDSIPSNEESQLKQTPKFCDTCRIKRQPLRLISYCLSVFLLFTAVSIVKMRQTRGMTSSPMNMTSPAVSARVRAGEDCSPITPFKAFVSVSGFTFCCVFPSTELRVLHHATSAHP